MLERLDRIEAVRSEKSGGNFKLKNVERAGNNVLTTEELAIGYGSKVLASGLNVSLHRGGALGIIGGNGTGKTTLLKTLIGEIRELGGKLAWGTKTNFGYYSQNLDDLHEGNDIISELRRVAPMAENVELRSFLARFLFFGEDVEKRVRDLSGGEKGRLALAKLIYSQKNVLILDEPTNHLDIPAREALESALGEYPGTIITVSHDRYFLDRIATQMLSFEADGSVLDYAGNYSEFHDWKAARLRSPEHAASSPDVEAAAEDTNTVSRASNLSKNQIQKIENRIRDLETRDIVKAEDDVAKLQAEMTDAAVAADPEKLREIAEGLNSAELRVKSLYGEWEDLLEQLK